MWIFIKVMLYVATWGLVPLFFAIKYYEISAFIGAILFIILVATLRSFRQDKPAQSSGSRQTYSSNNYEEKQSGSSQVQRVTPKSKVQTGYRFQLKPEDLAPELPSVEEDQARFTYNKGLFELLRLHQDDPLGNYLDEDLAFDLENHPELFPTDYHPGISVGRTPAPPPGPSDAEVDDLLDQWSKGKLR